MAPEAFFLARIEAECVGLSFLGPEEVAGEVRQGDTLVHPSWRRRGIATALKVRTVEWARAQGYTAILTNTANAGGMLAINLSLGFERLEGEVRLARDLV